MLALVAALVLAAAPSPPAPVVTTTGDVVGVAQTAGTLAWLERSASGCRFHQGRFGGGAAGALRYAAGCLPAPPAFELALAGGRAAWGGYTEVRCSETTAAVFATVGARARLVDDIPADCLGYRTAFQGLTTDGRSFYYAVLETKPPGDDSLDCGNGGPCHWQLAGGRVMRIVGGRAVPVRGLPPTALIAGAPGRLALVEPASRASSSGRVDWPRAAADGLVQVFDTRTGNAVASFRPHGTVRALALSPRRVVVLVEQGTARRFEWNDAETSRRLGSAAAPPDTARAVSTDGRYAAFVAGRTVRVLDLRTGRPRVVRRAAADPTAVSILNGRLVWAEGRRILTATL